MNEEKFDQESQEDLKADRFHRLLYENQGRIYAYVLSLVGNYPDSDDIVQETISTMWRKFDDFVPGTHFAKWGISIAHYKILTYRRKMQKQGTLLYHDDVFDQLPAHFSRNSIHHEDRTEILKECLKKLQDKSLTVIRLRYFENIAPQVIAKCIGISANNVYKILSRAHGFLLTCMKKAMIQRENIQ